MGLWLDVLDVTCIRIVILICVCSKRNVITLELLEYSWNIYFVSIDAGAQVAVFFYSRLDPVWSLCMVWTDYVLWVELPVQRRLYPIFVSSVGLPDIHEYSAG